MFDDPELVFGVVDEGDGGFGSGGDGEVCALEIEGVVVVDAALLAEGKVQVEQGRRGHGPEALGAGGEGVFPDGETDAPGAALAGEVLPLEFHLEDLVGVLRGGDFGVGKEGDEAALDFAFCLWGGRDEVGDAELRASRGGIERAIVKSRENPADKLRRQAMDELLFSSRKDAPKAVRIRQKNAEAGAGRLCPHQQPFRFCSGPDTLSGARERTHHSATRASPQRRRHAPTGKATLTLCEQARIPDH